MKKQIGLMTVGLMLASPALAGGAGAPMPMPKGACKSVAQIVAADPQFSTLATAIDAAGLKTALSAPGSLTVFAPTNAAFAKVPSDQLAAVLNDPAALRSLLLYHVVAEKATAAQIKNVKGGTTMQGGDITVMVKGNTVMINNAKIIKADVMACNGIVHVIDTVLMPPMTATAPAPKPAAPAPAPAPKAPAAAAPAPAPMPMAAPLMIPVLPASGATIDASKVGTAPMPAPMPMPAPAAAAPAPAPATSTTTTTTTDTTTTATTDSSMTVYDDVANDDRFSTLRDLLSDADLTETLTSGEYTLLAPTDDAFNALPDGVLTAIRSNPDALKQVLTYHVIPRKVMSEELTNGGEIKTVEGDNLNLGTATLGTPVTVTNGVVYPIDTVLLPEDFKVPDVQAIAADTSTTPPNITSYLVGETRFSVLRDLINTAGLAGTLSAGDFTLFAPTDEAFGKLDKDKLAAIKGDKAKLTAMLNYLLVTGHPDLAGLTAAPLKTVEGSDLTVAQDGTSTTLNVGDSTSNGQVIATGNGNIYAIDTVILPPSLR